jgi:NAD(P)-dependent dehydrogenase (short-subunit alcohol dehydrogenase family)
MSGRLDGRVVLVTGAARGIGAAVVTLFVAEGARVVAVDRDHVNEAPVDGVVFLTADVTDFDALCEAVAVAEREFGGLHAVVASAGIIAGGTVETTELELWQRVIDVNLTGTFLTAKAAIPALRRAGGGSIVTVASAAGITAWYDQAAYDASKGGCVNLSRSMALDFAADGIRVNCLVPAFVRTPMSDGFGAALPERRAEIIAQIPLGRFSEAEEIARGALFLASDESSYATGSTLVLDGGYLAK